MAEVRQSAADTQNGGAPVSVEDANKSSYKPAESLLRGRKNFNEFLRFKMDDSKRFILICAFTGLVCGLIAVGFHVSISATFRLIWSLRNIAGPQNAWWVMPLFPALGGLIAGICIYTFAPSAAGSGIPQTKDIFYNKFGIFKARDILYRFVLGTIFCGFGNSAGREGPTVHLCSAAASVIGQKAGLAKSTIQSLVPVGMGAGIAAAFNSPLSAISFVFEELLESFRTRALGGILVAVIIAAATDRIILGENPVLNLSPTFFKTGWWMLVCLPLAVIAGFAGDFFLKGLLKLRGLCKFTLKVPPWLLPAIGGLLVGALATAAFYATGYNSVFSVGYNSLLPAFDNKILPWAMLMLAAFKFLASMINYAMGGSGGLFSPTLVIGGMLGGAFGGFLKLAFGFDASVVSACVLLGMGTCFASIIRCPMTSILMIFELTLNYSLILPLLAGNLLAFYIAKRRSAVSLYNALLLQDGISLKKMTSFRGERDWKNLPVGAIMTFDVYCVNESDTPKEALQKISASSKSHRAYPVTDSQNRLVGTVYHSALKESANSQTSCLNLIKRDASSSITPDTSIRDTANLLIDKDILELPVITRNTGKIAGIITLHDIARQQNASESY